MAHRENDMTSKPERPFYIIWRKPKGLWMWLSGDRQGISRTLKEAKEAARSPAKVTTL